MEYGTISQFVDAIYSPLISIPEQNKINRTEFSFHTLLVGQTKTTGMVVNVDVPGLYLIEFEAMPGKGMQKIRDSVNIEESGEIAVIHAREFVLIE